MNSNTIFPKETPQQGILGRLIVLSALLHVAAMQLILVAYPPPTPQFPAHVRLQVLSRSTVPPALMGWVESQALPAATRMLRSTEGGRQDLIAYEPQYAAAKISLRNFEGFFPGESNSGFPSGSIRLSERPVPFADLEERNLKMVAALLLDHSAGELFGASDLQLDHGSDGIPLGSPAGIHLVLVPGLPGPLVFPRGSSPAELTAETYRALAILRPAEKAGESPVLGIGRVRTDWRDADAGASAPAPALDPSNGSPATDRTIAQ